MTIKLLTKDNVPVNVGDKVTSFRGEIATVKGWATNGRNRVYVRWDNGKGTFDGEYFPSVFDLHLDK